VRVTHAHHPLFGQQLPCVGKRGNVHGKHLLLQTDDGGVWSVPPQWTDLVSPDPEVVVSNGRALLLIPNLMDLASLIDRLSGKLAVGSQIGCKGNYTAPVNEITPLEERDAR
jgi:hypothetical protein